MDFIGDLAKFILLTWIAYWILAMIYFFTTGQIVIALLFVTGLAIPLAFIVYEYWKYRKT